jgi:hypothetical protein
MGEARDEDEEEEEEEEEGDRGRRANAGVGDAREAAVLEGEVLEERLAKAHSYLEPRS